MREMVKQFFLIVSFLSCLMSHRQGKNLNLNNFYDQTTTNNCVINENLSLESLNEEGESIVIDVPKAEHNVTAILSIQLHNTIWIRKECAVFTCANANEYYKVMDIGDTKYNAVLLEKKVWKILKINGSYLIFGIKNVPCDLREDIQFSGKWSLGYSYINAKGYCIITDIGHTKYNTILLEKKVWKILKINGSYLIFRIKNAPPGLRKHIQFADNRDWHKSQVFALAGKKLIILDKRFRQPIHFNDQKQNLAFFTGRPFKNKAFSPRTT